MQIAPGFSIVFLSLLRLSNDVFGSEAEPDQCGKCAGQKTSCHIISGIYTRCNLPKGYNKLATIASGACNVNISEVFPSVNFLALQLSSGKFILNGNQNFTSRTNFQAAGTFFTYQRPVVKGFSLLKENIFAKGPTNDTIHVYLWKRKSNLGVLYSYSLPILNDESKADDEKIQRDKPRLEPEEEFPPDQSALTRTGERQLKEKGVSKTSRSSRLSPHFDNTSKKHHRLRHRRHRHHDKKRKGVEESVMKLSLKSPAAQNDIIYPTLETVKQHSNENIENLKMKSEPYWVDDNLPEQKINMERLDDIDITNDQTTQSFYKPFFGYLDDNISTENYPKDLKNEYSWKVSGFTPCSTSCAGGIQTTIIVCIKSTSEVLATDDHCNIHLKPEVQQVTCSNLPCPPRWVVGNWSSCSQSCDGGTQMRSVVCQQQVTQVMSTNLSEDRCLDPKPNTSRSCPEAPPCARWKPSSWGLCSADCGKGHQSRIVTCVDPLDHPIEETKCSSPKPDSSMICDMGSCTKAWYYSDWSECSNDGCDENYQTRQAFCVPDGEDCRTLDEPVIKRKCPTTLPCVGHWYSGKWSECSVTCGNGTQTREVTCLKKINHSLLVVDHDNCINELKPNNSQKCENMLCHPNWFTSDWNECSKTCGSGFQKRVVKCLDAKQNPSTKCLPQEKPPEQRVCNSKLCHPSCADTFSNCQLVVKSKLCNYSFYRGICCVSCLQVNKQEDLIVM